MQKDQTDRDGHLRLLTPSEHVEFSAIIIALLTLFRSGPNKEGESERASVRVWLEPGRRGQRTEGSAAAAAAAGCSITTPPVSVSIAQSNHTRSAQPSSRPRALALPPCAPGLDGPPTDARSPRTSSRHGGTGTTDVHLRYGRGPSPSHTDRSPRTLAVFGA